MSARTITLENTTGVGSYPDVNGGLHNVNIGASDGTMVFVGMGTRDLQRFLDFGTQGANVEMDVNDLGIVTRLTLTKF